MNGNADELAKRFGFEPTPESVVRLTKMLARQDAGLDEIAAVIAQEQGLTARLLRAANPRAASERDYDITSVEQALMRNGMGCALLLAMTDSLQRAVTRTFQTMLAIKVENARFSNLAAIEGEQVVGQVRFAGHASGRIRLLLSWDAACLIASRMMGVETQDLSEFTMVSDGVGEVVNIVAGNFKSNLCDAGLDCKLAAPPVIQRTSDRQAPSFGGALSDSMVFKSPELAFVVDISVNPWND